MQAVVLVTPMIYTRPLSLACVVSDIHETGEAAANRRLDLLRMTLSREGLFAPARKRRLPTIPCCVGIITSRGSAAWHDVVAITRSRYPGIPLILVPAQMQGAAAPASIVSAIHRAEASRFFDVLIVTRGGGSADDLNVFNDERLARAIASSEVPIVTAVGHELDFSLADGVADARAATPSAAAALVVPMRRDLEGQLVRRTNAMIATVEHLVRQRQERLDAVRGNMARSAMLRVRDAQRHLDRLRSVLDHAASRRRAEQRAKVHHLVLSLKATLRRRVAAARSHHNTQDLQLAALSPNAIMTRGYVIARGRSGDGPVGSRPLPAGAGIHAPARGRHHPGAGCGGGFHTIHGGKVMTYEERMKRIEAITSALDSDRTPLSAALDLFEEGIGLSREALVQLAAMERKAQELIERANGLFDLVDINAADTGS